jgi:hypothetical protein
LGEKDAVDLSDESDLGSSGVHSYSVFIKVFIVEFMILCILLPFLLLLHVPLRVELQLAVLLWLWDLLLLPEVLVPWG